MKDSKQNRALYPQQAIIIYGSKRSYSDEYYLETCQVIKQGNKTTFSAPTPLAEDVFKAIAKHYAKKKGEVQQGGTIPECLLYSSGEPGNKQTIWYRPARKILLNFSASLKIKKHTEVGVPATIYWAKNNSLFIFAVKENDRPDSKTKLFRAPFFNIYWNGNVCLGSAKIGKPQDTFEGEIKRFEGGFYAAEQTHVSSERTKAPLPQIWNALIQGKGDFPLKELLPETSFKTFGDLLHIISGKKSETDPLGMLDEEEEVDIEI